MGTRFRGVVLACRAHGRACQALPVDVVSRHVRPTRGNHRRVAQDHSGSRQHLFLPRYSAPACRQDASACHEPLRLAREISGARRAHSRSDSRRHPTHNADRGIPRRNGRPVRRVVRFRLRRAFRLHRRFRVLARGGHATRTSRPSARRSCATLPMHRARLVSRSVWARKWTCS